MMHSIRNVRPSWVRSWTRPDVVGALRAQPYARTVVAPQTASLLRDFQPLLSPDPLDPLDAHAPTFGDQHPADPPVTVVPVLRGQPLGGGRQGRFVIATLRAASLRRPRLANHPTRTALRDRQQPRRRLQQSRRGLSRQRLVRIRHLGLRTGHQTQPEVRPRLVQSRSCLSRQRSARSCHPRLRPVIKLDPNDAIAGASQTGSACFGSRDQVKSLDRMRQRDYAMPEGRNPEIFPPWA